MTESPEEQRSVIEAAKAGDLGAFEALMRQYERLVLVTALRLVTNARGVSRLVVAWTAQVAGTSPVVSGGVVFVSGSGALSALDARSGRKLWSSTRPSAGGTIGDIHWQSPIAVNGRVYISDQAGHLTAYALPGR